MGATEGLKSLEETKMDQTITESKLSRMARAFDLAHSRGQRGWKVQMAAELIVFEGRGVGSASFAACLTRDEEATLREVLA